MRFHQVRRREFLTVLFGLVAWPLPARAQEPEKVARIGFLGAISAGDLAKHLDAPDARPKQEMVEEQSFVSGLTGYLSGLHADRIERSADGEDCKITLLFHL